MILFLIDRNNPLRPHRRVGEFRSISTDGFYIYGDGNPVVDVWVLNPGDRVGYFVSGDEDGYSGWEIR